MDQETFNSMVFMAFGLGFFIFVITLATRILNRDQSDDTEAAHRRMMEILELRHKVKKPPPELSDPTPKE